MKTIINTHGKVLQTGDQGVQVVSESGIPLFVIGEVSDDVAVNVFLTMEKNGNRPISLNPVEQGAGSMDWEILMPQPRKGSVCENCEAPCEYDSEMCLCSYCKLRATANGDECPVCGNGTVEIVGDETRCKGECGQVVGD